MAHHKRGRPKNRRAGCLMCKPHKANGAKHKAAPRYAALECVQALAAEAKPDGY